MVSVEQRRRDVWGDLALGRVGEHGRWRRGNRHVVRRAFEVDVALPPGGYDLADGLVRALIGPNARSSLSKSRPVRSPASQRWRRNSRKVSADRGDRCLFCRAGNWLCFAHLSIRRRLQPSCCAITLRANPVAGNALNVSNDSWWVCRSWRLISVWSARRRAGRSRRSRATRGQTGRSMIGTSGGSSGRPFAVTRTRRYGRCRDRSRSMVSRNSGRDGTGRSSAGPRGPLCGRPSRSGLPTDHLDVGMGRHRGSTTSVEC